MLKIEAAGLPIISWSQRQPDVGQWLATAGMNDDPLAVGIVSVPRRAIPPTGGLIGVMLTQKDGPVQIEQVLPQGPAEKAGLKVNDIITRVNGDPVQDIVDLVELVHRHRVGETIKLGILRGQETLEIPVQPAKLAVPALQRQEMLNSMGVGASGRADDFPAVIQHDTVLKPADCGGPVVDLSGKVVGVNIAHADRTESYCIPADTLVGVMYELMSGRLSPALLEATKKAEDEKAAAEKKVAEERAAAEKRTAEAKAAADKKAAEEKAAADKAAAEKKAAEEKAAAEKKTAEEKAAEEKPEEQK
jgi:serine protease Do